MENEVEIEFEENSISRTRVKFTNKRTVVVIRRPVEYTEESILGVMNHEIGTHVLRKKNDRRQGFYNKREEFGMGVESKETEEGLAILSQLIDEPQPRMFIAALRYYSAILASQMSFVEVFKKLKTYLPDEQDCWR